MANTGFDNNNLGSTLVDNALSNVAGILSTRPTAKYLSGARITLKINGKLVGFAFAITWNITTDYVEINTCDDYLPYELAPRRITVDGTISCLHIPGTSAGTEGWQPDVLSFLFQPYISIEARDAGTNQVVFSTDKAMIEQRSEEIRVDQLSSVTLRWRAIGFVDEKNLTQTSPPNNYNQDSQSAAQNANNNSLPGGVSNILPAVNLPTNPVV
jgi:hypothetical protein